MKERRFTPEDRAALRERLLALARADPEIVAAAVTGSMATGAEDEWSDIDLGLAVADGVAIEPAIARWTEAIEREAGLVHRWDLPFGATTFRVFLLPSGLEVDLAFTPVAAFGARGPNFRLVFGEEGETPPDAAADIRNLTGLGWHHLMHARACIARGKLWQAEWLISAARDHALALACVRLDLPALYARGVDRLPDSLRSGFEDAVVRSIDAKEMRRALAAMQRLYLEEVERSDPGLAERLEGVFSL
jgi:hypothetical protein